MVSVTLVVALKCGVVFIISINRPTDIGSAQEKLKSVPDRNVTVIMYDFIIDSEAGYE